MTSIDEILDNFSLLDDWEDRYRYVIELGGGLEPLTEAEHAPEYKVRGCASQVWFVSEAKPDGQGGTSLTFRGDSDAHIVRGLIAILIAIYSGKPAREILSFDTEGLFARMGLKDHLTQQRSNGLASMVQRIRSDAAAALGASADAGSA
ncbi:MULTISPECIES: SufE family protein [Rhodomicrobium]|uniref:SufE family protein n=1 Tax=Rhodomicrobium TaxID=1068 RepID=UPI000B4A74CC|nr:MULTISPECIES: SufE family protein [Rhodomicrobium]